MSVTKIVREDQQDVEIENRYSAITDYTINLSTNKSIHTVPVIVDSNLPEQL